MSFRRVCIGPNYVRSDTTCGNHENGTDQFHGAVFEFLRNTDLDARSYCATATEKFNLNQFGVAVGGPVKKDNVFFFADYEEKYQRLGFRSPASCPPRPCVMAISATMPSGSRTRFS